VASAVRAVAGAVDRVRSAVGPSREGSSAAGGRPASGWLAVTVLREPEEVGSTPPPAPLAELGDAVEVRVRRAPGGRGSELAARVREGAPASRAGRLGGGDPEGELRSALRRAKQLLEVGEVLAVDPVPHGERTATPGGALLEAWTRVAPKGGVR